MAKIIWIDTKGNRQESKEYSDIKIFRSYIYKYVDDIKIVEVLDCNGLDTLYDKRLFGGLFQYCTNLVKVEKVIGTLQILDMSEMFRDCGNLESVPYFDTPNVEDACSMFNGCSKLKEVPCFDTSSVKNMCSMFKGCSSLESVPLFDTTSVKYMMDMFAGCNKLRSYTLPCNEYITRSSAIESYEDYKKSWNMLEKLNELWQK